MKIQQTPAFNVSFGIKVPTKDVINLVSGIESKETTDLFTKLTGISNEKMLTSMNKDVIESGKSYCASEVTKFMPELKNLAKIKEDLHQLIIEASSRTDGGVLTKVNNLFTSREVERNNLFERLPGEIDIPQIKLPF